jgi:hypothetical protein
MKQGIRDLVSKYPNSIFRHRKSGKVYRLLTDQGRLESQGCDGSAYCFYAAIEDEGTTWARPALEFFQVMEDGKPRFEHLQRFMVCTHFKSESCDDYYRMEEVICAEGAIPDEALAIAERSCGSEEWEYSHVDIGIMPQVTWERIL